MAGDWIKMRVDMYRDPKVSAIADLLLSEDGELAKYISQNMQRDMCVTRNVMRNVTVGALLSVWGVMRTRGKRVDDDLVCRCVTPAVIDDIADLPGMGDAMVYVGWVVVDDEGIVFPRFFEEHNVDPAESMRQKNAERQRRFREKHNEKNNVTSNVTVTHREEKRREDKTNDDASFGFDAFWLSYPNKKGKGQAVKAWNKIAPSHELLEKMLSALNAQKQSHAWTKDDGQFIPHPATWLNGMRWEDEIQNPGVSSGPITAQQIALMEAKEAERRAAAAPTEPSMYQQWKAKQGAAA